MTLLPVRTYGERAERHRNPAAKALLQTMDRKKSNLCVSVDVTRKAEFLAIVDATGPYVCLIKVTFQLVELRLQTSTDLWCPQTHIDIIEDFDEDLISQLQELSKKHDFLIFEDRKFADIGACSV